MLPDSGHGHGDHSAQPELSIAQALNLEAPDLAVTNPLVDTIDDPLMETSPGDEEPFPVQEGVSKRGPGRPKGSIKRKRGQDLSPL